jgi:hypothetical protein
MNDDPTPINQPEIPLDQPASSTEASATTPVDYSKLTIIDQGDNHTIYVDPDGNRYLEDDYGFNVIDPEAAERSRQAIREQNREQERAYARFAEVSRTALSATGESPYGSSASRTQERTRFWSVERSAEAVDALVGSDLMLTQAVVTLANGSIGVVRAIKEKLADEVSYDPAEALTPDRIRSIVGAPSDPALLDSWRKDFYEPYRQKYRAEDADRH